MQTTFTFSTITNEWQATTGQMTFDTAHGSTMPEIASTDDHDQHAIGELLCHVMVNNQTVPLRISLCHNILMLGAGESVGALVSENNLSAFIAASGLSHDCADDIAEQIAYGLNEGWQTTGGDANVYDDDADDELSFPWTLVSLTFTDDFIAVLS